MFEKSFTIKDIIIYLIPGVINTILLAKFISNIFLPKISLIDFIRNNISLSILGVAISFLIGFIFSQIQIILSNKIFKDEFRKLRTLNSAIEIETFKPVICEIIKKVFKLDNISNDDLLKNHQIFFYCYSFVLEKANNKSIELINRANNLSSFAASMYIPLLLIILNLCYFFKISCILEALPLFFTLLVLYYAIAKITLNFKSEFYNNTFRTFYLKNRK
ncbi:hypothetical protein [Elizabethkingia anophelis]|uniref:hypothetical protein n=1 Tax=Elizabethkingia anophelis TaxID=1117645 RepID=UPI0021A2F482|nr:hypothetical protein [Elizabethkingia anophelis]MCT3719905.1 hypothetical protein [Elizabethkingia anophelis]MCT3723415.1 hypothetical protein [Elizabethkingia anophelis]MCT3776553.1 hypothetical protein [Elizabethkingia anophelis]MCT3783666.1 hypothetical protein [Elizabethkingia anophelis]MCT3790943.1 hypothetical protein [Elizabethkingia anophelis]